MFKLIHVTIAAIFLLILLRTANSVRVEDSFEQKCPDSPFVTQSFANWAGNLTKGTCLYFPMLSGLDRFRIIQDLLQKSDLGFLSQKSVDNSCIKVEPSNVNSVFRLTFHGFNGRSASKVMTSDGPLTFKWEKIFAKGLSGKFTVSLSNSRTWQVVDVCWSDGQRSFAVISLYPTLSSCTIRIIIEHLKAIGFNPKFFTFVSYKNCPASCGKNKPNPEYSTLPTKTGTPYIPY